MQNDGQRLLLYFIFVFIGIVLEMEREFGFVVQFNLVDIKSCSCSIPIYVCALGFVVQMIFSY